MPSLANRANTRRTQLALITRLRLSSVGPLGVASPDGTGRELRRYISAREVLAPGFDPARVAGKIAFLAVIDLGRIDERRSPLGPIIYGVEAHMQMIEQITTGHFLRRPRVWRLNARLDRASSRSKLHDSPHGPERGSGSDRIGTCDV